MRKNDSPKVPYIEGEIQWELICLKFKERVTREINPAQFPKKSSTVGFASLRKDWGTRNRKNINEGAPHIPKHQGRNLDSLKTPCNQKWCKMGAKGLLSHHDHSFPPWSRKEESRGAIVEVKGQGANIYVYVGSRA